MPTIQNILVGIDVAPPENPATTACDSVAACALRQGLWLAEKSSARLTLFSVLPPPISDQGPAQQALAALVRDARAQGINADAATAIGQPWQEMTRRVVRDHYDLVVVGTHDRRGLERFLLGGTARKLLHECPCPVWVCKASAGPAPSRVLIASDLSPLSDRVARVGLEVGEVTGAYTHILDVVEYPLDRIWAPDRPDPITERYHREVRQGADRALHAQVDRNMDTATHPLVSVHVAEGDGLPEHAIVDFIGEHRIDLLVLGTVARHGVAGALFGNTAERLLPQVPCSVLAVKAADFQCTVDVAGA